MDRTQATAIGQDALIWLAGHPDRVAALLAASGLAPEDLRERAADPDLLGFVLEFLLGDEASVIAFAADAGLDPAAAARAPGDPAVKGQLREATEAAWARGVRGVPTLTLGEALFYGDDQLEAAALTPA
ncbi:MAG TPA: DUF3572 family protein [Solirubrobacteraceae bacterium]